MCVYVRVCGCVEHARIETYEWPAQMIDPLGIPLLECRKYQAINSLAKQVGEDDQFTLAHSTHQREVGNCNDINSNDININHNHGNRNDINSNNINKTNVSIYDINDYNIYSNDICSNDEKSISFCYWDL